jgi:hypothetical protein
MGAAIIQNDKSLGINSEKSVTISLYCKDKGEVIPGHN